MAQDAHRPVGRAGTDGDVVLGAHNTSITETVLEAEWMSGAGVLKLLADDNGTALDVRGKIRSNRSGRATVRAGKQSVDVDLRPEDLPFTGLEGTPLCFANLMSYRPGVFVISARPNHPIPGKIRIYLNKPTTADAYVAWFVLG